MANYRYTIEYNGNRYELEAPEDITEETLLNHVKAMEEKEPKQKTLLDVFNETPSLAEETARDLKPIKEAGTEILKRTGKLTTAPFALLAGTGEKKDELQRLKDIATGNIGFGDVLEERGVNPIVATIADIGSGFISGAGVGNALNKIPALSKATQAAAKGIGETIKGAGKNIYATAKAPRAIMSEFKDAKRAMGIKGNDIIPEGINVEGFIGKETPIQDLLDKGIVSNARDAEALIKQNLAKESKAKDILLGNANIPLSNQIIAQQQVLGKRGAAVKNIKGDIEKPISFKESVTGNREIPLFTKKTIKETTPVSEEDLINVPSIDYYRNIPKLKEADQLYKEGNEAFQNMQKYIDNNNRIKNDALSGLNEEGLARTELADQIKDEGLTINQKKSDLIKEANKIIENTPKTVFKDITETSSKKIPVENIIETKAMYNDLLDNLQKEKNKAILERQPDYEKAINTFKSEIEHQMNKGNVTPQELRETIRQWQEEGSGFFNRTKSRYNVNEKPRSLEEQKAFANLAKLGKKIEEKQVEKTLGKKGVDDLKDINKSMQKSSFYNRVIEKAPEESSFTNSQRLKGAAYMNKDPFYLSTVLDLATRVSPYLGSSLYKLGKKATNSKVLQNQMSNPYLWSQFNEAINKNEE